MNIYEKIDKLYSKDNQDKILKQILSELYEIKAALKTMENPRRNRKINKDYYNFVNSFRNKMQPDTENKIYPEVQYKGRRIGVNFKGYLYDKDTTNTLPKIEAFELYEYFYEKKDEIERYIIND